MTTRRRIAWLLWGVTAGLAAGHAALFFLGDAHLLDEAGHLKNFPLVTAAGLVGATVGALVVNRHARHLVGWLFVVGYLLLELGIFTADYGSRVPSQAAATLHHLANWVGLLTGALLIVPIFTAIALLFPDGRLPSPRWRVAAWANGLNVVATSVLLAIGAGFPTRALPEDEIEPGFAVGVALNVTFTVMLVLLGVAVASLVVRLRSADGDRRRQLLWLLVAVAYLGIGVAGITVREPLTTVGVPFWTSQLVLLLGPSAIPVAAGVAIFRYRLYDVELVLNRALVLGTLVGFVTLAYVGVVVGVGSVVSRRSEPSLGLTLLATAAVAVAFQPLHRQAQRLADRVVYGRRAAPYEVMAQLAQTMADAVDLDDVLPRTAHAAAAAAGVETAAVQVRLAGDDDPAAPDQAGTTGPTNGTGPANSVSVEVRHGGEVVGHVVVKTAAGRQLARSRASLLRELAVACGPALRTVRLTAELRRRVTEIAAVGDELRSSRRRILASRDEERQVLEEEIDTRVLARLRSVETAVVAAERLLATAPGEAEQALSAASAQAAAALEQLRDLAGGVFPSLLADRGVVAAVDDRLRRAGTPGPVRLDGLPPAVRFPPATEAAIYLCCSEVAEASSRNAELDARPAVVMYADGDSVVVEVTGAMPDERRTQRIRDRVEGSGGQLSLAGGFLAARLPATEVAAAVEPDHAIENRTTPLNSRPTEQPAY